MLRVNGECKFINGIFNASSSTSPLLFSTNGFVSGSFPANNNSHVNGYVYREGIGAFTYPVGDGLAYQPVIVNLSSNPNGIKVKYNGTNAGSGSFSSSGTESTPLTSYNTLENWEISPSTVATGSVTVFWDAYKNTPVPDVSLAKVAHKFFTQWLNEGTTATGLPTAGSVTSNSITTWGNFTLGAISPVCTTPVVQATASNSTICSGTSTTLTASGATSYTWQPGGFTGASINVSPLSTTTYTVTGTVTGGCSATAIQTIQVNTCNSVLNLKAFIEGYYDGGGMMKPVLMNQGVAGASASQTDTITVELHSFSFPLFTASSVKTILNTNGTATCSFPVSGNYYLAVKHRNGLQTWSSNYITMGPTPVNYDFTTAANQAFNSNQTEVSPGVFAFYSGDVNADENLDLLDVS
ncbi:MAG TPA: hypothetical protein PLP14_11205, partial [Chitinophagaceae bacterium]|nr:hypothetical protein [Chitinophagaceae bacterium]